MYFWKKIGLLFITNLLNLELRFGALCCFPLPSNTKAMGSNPASKQGQAKVQNESHRYL